MDRYRLSFSPEDNEIKLNELSNFLYYFRAAYAFAANEYSDLSIEQFNEDPDQYIREFIKHLKFIGRTNQVTKYFFDDLGDFEIYFDAADKNSPLKIVGACLAVALTLAVIVSGGKAKVAGAEFELNPLGDGIAKLRSAFGKLEYDPEPTKKQIPGNEQGSAEG